MASDPRPVFGSVVMMDLVDENSDSWDGRVLLGVLETMDWSFA